MYASFFGLRELPFNNTPDPRYFFSTPDHEEALASLIYAVAEAKGFVLLTGEVGAGKTLVTRLLLRHFGDRIAFAAINNTQMNADDLMQSVCTEFDIDVAPTASNAERVRRLQDYLLRSFAANKPVVLMLDEAQALSRDAFEQVRMIGNLEADDTKLLQILIVGQPELRERFEAGDMRQLRQRLFRSFHLHALTREQTEGYVRHRLSVAGAPYPDRIFVGPALDAIHEFSQGLPRLINTVCDNAMLSAYAADQQQIDALFVAQVIAQMMHVTRGGMMAMGEADGPRDAALPAAYTLSAPVVPRWPTAPGNIAPGQPAAPPRDPGAPSGSDERRWVARGLAAEARRMRAEIEEGQADFLERAAAQRVQMRKLAGELRKLIEDAKRATASAQEAAAAARQAGGAADRATARLVSQSTAAGKLCTTLRAVYSKLETKAAALQGRADSLLAGSASLTVAAPTARPEHRVRAEARKLDDSIHESRRSMEELRSLIAATNAASARAHVPAGSTQPSRLAERVRELNELVDAGKSPSAVKTWKP